MALLIWGIHMVQTGVRRAFGAGLRRFLSRTLRSRFKAFLAGLGVTAVLQSSTATALMVTGFAAEGLVGLPPALAVVLGANVGTTLIVQALSFDVVIIAPGLILAGVVLFERARGTLHDFGRVLIGLSFVLMALHQFLTLLAPLAADSTMRSLLTALAPHIVFLVLVGAVLTWAAHSSVAVVLLAMTLASDAVVPLPAAIALCLGANLGTAINPVLEGGKGRDPAGLRLALGNLLNRATGVVIALAAFSQIAPLLLRIEPAPARAVADFHTGFNVVLAALFFPWVGAYARLLERLVSARSDKTSPGAPLYLQPALRAEPASALGAAAREALRMADVVEQMLIGLKDALIHGNRTHIEETKRLDDILDRLNTAIKDYVVSIEPERFTAADREAVERVLSFSISLERAGDLIDRNLLGVVNRRLKRGLSFSPEGEADLVALVDRLIANARTAAALFVSGDVREAHALAHEKTEFRDFEARAVAAHFQRLQEGNVETVETSSLHLDALAELRRLNAYLVEAAAYPILRRRGELLASRVQAAPGAQASTAG